MVSPAFEVGRDDVRPDRSRFCGVTLFEVAGVIRIRLPSPLGGSAGVTDDDLGGEGASGILVMFIEG
jgi:hypothetical protein